MNRFDDSAATWDDEVKTERAQQVAEAVLGAVALVPDARILEYGAGTGLVSQALLQALPEARLTLADNSAGMRQVMSEKIAAGALPSGSRVWDLDLETQEAPSGDAFDLVVTSLVLHHVHDLERAVVGLAALVAPGGALCVADLDAEDGSFHAQHHDFDGHDGFDRAHVAALMERCGLTEVRVEDCTTIVKEGTAYPVFLATGTRR